jgi:hypothetical protein
MPHLAQINQDIRRSGLAPRGALRLVDAERTGDLAEIATIVLIGMRGREGWSAFAESEEKSDGRAHPLDRWSRRIIDGLARACFARAFYPFVGPPYLPFQTWAMRAEPVHVSPLGALIHREYGLWHSYRGALGFAEPFPIPKIERGASPCEACVARPCLSACPVSAFSSTGYDVETCAAHLAKADGAACLEGGCLARRACPIGEEHRHGAEQASFHMRAFFAARPR